MAVVNCTVDSSTSENQALNNIVTKANCTEADFLLSIHLNASDTFVHDTEIYTYNGKEIPEARNILNNIIDMDYTNRGIKDGSHLAVVKNTHACSMLIKLCFIDNKADMSKFSIEKMADAIVLSLCGKLPVVKTTPSTKIKIEVWKTVTATTLNIRSGQGANFPIIGELHKGDKIRIDRDYKESGFTSILYISNVIVCININMLRMPVKCL
ncbi:N-acetylmuramoyl-L-alanine amidase [Clostridium estertheticum]|uniref:N-acetylmuramoyl-L-alanine amidase n=1 Tax=Clostridium estertheticum TaxID=238834 RepID=UPI0013E8F922|nr:N-acetylmuramoyl-L-alanine amidase [Clostridium estertheticum]MBZ9687570.1 N-acetylmuramoyl-L-alanine amidase [Clostridium estertheticum]